MRARFKGKVTRSLCVWQAAQLLVCDWLLETRTALWENDYEAHKSDANYVASQSVLLGFQEDLSSLKKLVQHLPVCDHRSVEWRLHRLTELFTGVAEHFATRVFARGHAADDGWSRAR